MNATLFPKTELMRLWREDLKEILSGHDPVITPLLRPDKYRPNQLLRPRGWHRDFMMRTASDGTRFQARVCSHLNARGNSTVVIASVWGFSPSRVSQLLRLAKDMAA